MLVISFYVIIKLLLTKQIFFIFLLLFFFFFFAKIVGPKTVSYFFKSLCNKCYNCKDFMTSVFFFRGWFLQEYTEVFLCLITSLTLLTKVTLVISNFISSKIMTKQDVLADLCIAVSCTFKIVSKIIVVQLLCQN